MTVRENDVSRHNGDELWVPFKHVNTIILWCTRGLRGALNRSPMMPRYASLSDSYTANSPPQSPPPPQSSPTNKDHDQWAVIPNCNFYHFSPVRLITIGMMRVDRVPLKSLDAILPWYARGNTPLPLLDTVLMVPRGASPSGGWSPKWCRSSSRAVIPQMQ